ncbi:olfactory receptor 5AR1-like [Mantella aurantiaca]
MSAQALYNVSVTPVNVSSVTEFIFLGITSDQALLSFLFPLFLLIYLITVFGNSTIILIILMINDLHNPMYFFLSNLSFSDLCFCSTVTPKMLFDLFSERKVITFIGCVLQLFSFATFATTEGYLLSAMAYDRFVAICHPLLYVVIMNRSTRVGLLAVVYFGGLLTAGIHTTSTFSLSFCASNVINHFYCDIYPLMSLSCSDTYMNKTVVFGIVATLGLFSAAVTFTSYAYIFFTILNIRSLAGRHKAFSTCSSHLSCVALFYGTVFFMYLRPASSDSITQEKVVSVFYTMIIPMINPIIYTLRNREVKDAVTRYIKRLL